MNEVCPKCRETGVCWFAQKSEEIRNKAENRVSLNVLLKQKISIPEEIAKLEIHAREQGCPFLAKYN